MNIKKLICGLFMLCTLFGSVKGPNTRALAEVSNRYEACSVSTVQKGDVKVSSRIWELLFGKDNNDSSNQGEGPKGAGDQRLTLIPCGAIFGAKIKQPYVTVSDSMNNQTLRAGDIILGIDGISVKTVSDVKSAISQAQSECVKVKYKRDGNIFSSDIKLITQDGGKKIGVTLRDGAAGIGTVTYINPITMEFGGLGHGIVDSESSELIEVSSGSVTGVILGGVHRGEAGKAGELSGVLTDKCLGSVSQNTDCGLFGTLSDNRLMKNAPMEIGYKGEIKTGEATILSTVKNNKTAEYKIEITEIDLSSDGNKSFKIKVTDPVLIAETGGIVRGMSGSPIIQNGRLIGAVTHVLINDPTMGYGIFIENMLNASESARNELPAA